MKKDGALDSNTVVTTVMSNIGLYKAFDDLGIKYEKTDVGDKNVHDRMYEKDVELGGEQSGHIIIKKFANTGDGILTSLKIMEAMIESKNDLKSLVRDLKIYPQVLINVRVKDKNTVLDNEKVRASVEKIERELENSGRVLVRKSGTEPLIRVMVEAETEEIANDSAMEIVNTIKENGLSLD